MDVVIVPTFDRPELLHHCLAWLGRAVGIADKQVWVRQDARAPCAARREAFDVAAAFPFVASATASDTHMYPGNSFNTLSALRDAFVFGAERVYLVEDDVLVSEAFFVWHESAPRDVAASIGVPNPGHGAYASLGVCLPRRTLASVLRHARPAYFADMRGYCTRRFPPSPFDVEQDGLIARVLAGQRVAWAPTPVCAHVGWYGYHRRHTVQPRNVRLDERIAYVGMVLADPALLEQLAKGAHDVRPPVFTDAGGYDVTTVPGVPE